jgi:hypothetical protein
MHSSIRFCLAGILALAACSINPALAQTRQPRGDAARAVPKIGSTTYAASAAALAATIAGSGVTVSNAIFRGSSRAAGTFTGGSASVGIADGVVLSTGDIVDVRGPNDSESSGEDLLQPGDTALDALVAPYMTQDAAILEFDVTTAQATIGIRFVFASEEYNEYVGSPYNDVLAIFVSGVNCASYNGLPVSINSINAGSNQAFYIDNTNMARNTQFDGMTVPLECVAVVTPNVPAHVKIAIADTADGIYDAAVFLASGGVVAPGSGPPTTSTVIKAIEYHHAGFDHYFITPIPGEIDALDNGPLSAAWKRTGEAFNVYALGAGAGTLSVCRFFSTAFAPKSSHFYTPYKSECDILKAGAVWGFEGDVFNLAIPAADGSCAAGTGPLYRVYNSGQGAAPNHRYTTSLTTRQTMVGMGWVAEGNGPGVVFACVPL